MSKTKLLLVIFGAFVIGSAAQGAVYTYVPSTPDLYDLDHHDALLWGINWDHTEAITGVEISFTGIYDWTDEIDDILYISVLDNASSGLHFYPDLVSYNENYFAGSGVLAATWSDLNGGLPAEDITLTFGGDAIAALNSYVLDGNFGIGFDPDCHYFNSGATLKVTTADQPIPEPGTMLLFGMGLTGLGIYRRRK